MESVRRAAGDVALQISCEHRLLTCADTEEKRQPELSQLWFSAPATAPASSLVSDEGYLDMKSQTCNQNILITTITRQRLKNISLQQARAAFLCKACNRIGGLATNPPCDEPVEDYSTLHRGPRQGFVTEGPRQRFVTEGGPRQAPISRHCLFYCCHYSCYYDA